MTPENDKTMRVIVLVLINLSFFDSYRFAGVHISLIIEATRNRCMQCYIVRMLAAAAPVYM